MLKRILVLFFLIAFGLCFVSEAKAQEKIKIGVVRFSDESFYLESLAGILAQLKKEGFDNFKVDLDIRNADGDKEKVIDIIKEFKDKKVSLLITLGTTPAIVAHDEIKDIPIVFSMVFDPINSGIAKSWESSGNNLTGSSTWMDLRSIVKIIRKIAPGKHIGVIYNEAEKNSVLQLTQFNKLQDELDFKVVPLNLSKPEDAKLLAESLVGKADSVFLTGSTVVGKGIEAILEVVKKAKIVSVAHVRERADQGVLLALASNSFQLGELAGKKASQILRGASPALMPIETLEYYDVTVNLQTAKEMDLEIPDSILKSAKNIIE